MAVSEGHDKVGAEGGHGVAGEAHGVGNGAEFASDEDDVGGGTGGVRAVPMAMPGGAHAPGHHRRRRRPLPQVSCLARVADAPV